MRKVLIVTGRYLPGYKDGGPVRTIKNLTDILGQKYEFKILTSDRDHGDVTSYPNIKINNWNKVGNADVFYVKDSKFKLKYLLKASKNVDLIYCCGPYDSYAIKLLMLKKFHFINKTLSIASMGSFSKGALSIKSNKKKIFFSILNHLKMFNNIIWSVTSNTEEQELKKIINDAQCIIAEDLPRNIVVERRREKKANELKIIFLSRVCEMKNLLGAINMLKEIDKNIFFDIYGNIEDLNYWKKCEQELNNFPKNIRWKYMGEAESDTVVSIFSNYDILLLPTLGENFGHVISEALLGGCLPVISDNTPWTDLEKNNCGRIIPIDDEAEYIRAINSYYSMNNLEFKQCSINAQKYIYEKNNNSIKHTGYLKVFDYEANNND